MDKKKKGFKKGNVNVIASKKETKSAFNFQDPEKEYENHIKEALEGAEVMEAMIAVFYEGAKAYRKSGKSKWNNKELNTFKHCEAEITMWRERIKLLKKLIKIEKKNV